MRHQESFTPAVMVYLNNVKAALKTFEKIYFTVPKYCAQGIDLSKNYLFTTYLPENYKNVDYLFNFEEAFERAYNELAQDETLLIICRDNFRAFREIVQENKNKSLNNMQYNIGVELEFNCDNLEELFQIFIENNIDYEWSNSLRTNTVDKLVVKRETTVNGYEICFPPGYDKVELVLNLMKTKCYFTENCALHVHISNYNKINTESLNTICEYYKDNEGYIIQDLVDRDLFLNKNI